MSSSNNGTIYAEPSICIPRLFPNITEARIKKTFDALNIGVVAKIDIIERANKNGEKIKRAYVHLNHGIKIQMRLKQKKF